MEKEFLRKYTKVTLPGHEMMSKVIDIEDAIEIAEKYKQSATAVVIPKIAEENEALKRLCEEWFVKPMIQPYAGANQECLFCGAAYDRNGGVHHSASDCPVIKYNDIKSNFSE